MAIVIDAPDELVDAIIANLKARKGFDEWWDSIDWDIQYEILTDLTQIVQEW